MVTLTIRAAVTAILVLAGANSMAQERTTAPGADKNESDDVIEEVVTSGSHIRGLNNPTLPIVVLDRKYIESTGISSTAALLDSLPQNFSLSSQSAIKVPGTQAATQTLQSQGYSINLRGIGEGTTLVLVNGRRLALSAKGTAADISAFPISAIERVEIITDGASALYGADAIGGVVNFVLRRDYAGAETQLRSGWAKGGINEYRGSQLFGYGWTSGNALISAEYYSRDLLMARDRDFVPETTLVGGLLPEEKNYSLSISGSQQIGDKVDVFVDALYTKRGSANKAGIFNARDTFETDNPQLNSTVGLDWEIGRGWQIEVSGGYAEDQTDVTRKLADPGPNGYFYSESEYSIKSAQVKADGSLFKLPGGDVRAALGLDWRQEALSDVAEFQYNDKRPTDVYEQRIRGAFGEIYVPVVGKSNALPGVRQLSLSLQGRYDEYSNFGSSFDPRIGLRWEMLNGLSLRGSIGSSYKAPRLVDYSRAFNYAYTFYFTSAFPTGPDVNLLEVGGTSPDSYKAQTSDNYSIGLDIAPAYLPNLKLSISYWDIKFKDIVGGPRPSLLTPSEYDYLIIHDPTPEQVFQYISYGAGGFPFESYDRNFVLINPAIFPFDPATVDVILDGRRTNLASVHSSGVDVSAHYAFTVGTQGFELGVDGTYNIERVTKTSRYGVGVDNIDTIYNPPEYVVRAGLGWQRDSLSANFFTNFKDAYIDNRSAGVTRRIGSGVTVDMRVAYKFTNSSRGALSGLTIGMSALNILDKDPPRVAVLNDAADTGFDPTNANPMGRLIAIEVTKDW